MSGESGQPGVQLQVLRPSHLQQPVSEGGGSGQRTVTVSGVGGVGGGGGGAGSGNRNTPPAVRLVSLPLSQHIARGAGAGAGASQIQTSQPQAKPVYHVPRGPAAVASLSVPRASAAPRVPVPSSSGWNTTNNQLRASSVSVYPSRPASRPPTLQVATTQRPATLRPTVPQAVTAVVARAVRPVNTPSQRTPPSQVIQTATPVRTVTPKVSPFIQRNYQPAKVVSVATLRSNITQINPRAVSSTFYYELPGNVNNTSQTNAISTPVSTVALSTTTLHPFPISITPTHTTVNAYPTSNASNLTEITRPPSSPISTSQRPSILRKRDNEGSPIKSQWSTGSPPLSPGGGSTTESAGSGTEMENDDPPPPIAMPMSLPQHSLSLNNYSPRKKPRKQMLSSDVRGTRSSECEFPSEGVRPPAAPSPPPAIPLPPPPPPPEPEKPRRALLGSAWRCDWRANALHFVRPSDVRRREERRPSVVELAAQKHVLQKANGWKVHHLTAQMDDIIELESGVLQQATEALKQLDKVNHPDLDRISELLKGNIQRSKIVCEGVAEARTNILRIFQHKSRVSDILARQVDKRCFKKHRNQY